MSTLPLVDQRATVRLTGAVYTPPKVASALVKYCLKLLETTEPCVLEPSVGDGSFLTELYAPESQIKHLTAIDIDGDVISALRLQNQDSKRRTQFIQDDFVGYAIEHHVLEKSRFDLIVGNPPFIRKHSYSQEFKARLDTFATVFEYPNKHLKNTWASFLVAATEFVSEHGIVAFILPYELLTVDYGQKALKYLQDYFERIDVLVSREKAFHEIDQDAVVLVAQKSTSKRKGLFITKVANFEKLSTKGARKTSIRDGAQRGIELNSFLLPSTSLELLNNLRKYAKTVAEHTASAPGVVSAANDFFIRTKSDIAQLNLDEYAIPILKKGSFASSQPIFSSENFEKLKEKEPCFLLHFRGELNSLTQTAQDYIELGREQLLHERYKCRNRKNWYEVPLVPRRPGFFFKRSHSHLRMLINEAQTLITDTAYGLDIRDGYSMNGLCFSFYTSLTMLFAEMDGRFYGGGVLELSPKEFRGLPLVYHEPTKAEFERFLKVHSDASGGIDQILDFGDSWLSTKLALTTDELMTIRKSWATIRHHRLRHGGRSS